MLHKLCCKILSLYEEVVKLGGTVPLVLAPLLVIFLLDPVYSEEHGKQKELLAVLR